MDYRKSIKTPLGALLAGFSLGIFVWLPADVTVGALLLLPVLLKRYKTSLKCLLCMIGYYLACTHGMVQGISQFPGGSWALGLGLWFGSATILATPYLLIPRFGGLAWLLVFAILFLPPLGFMNWVSPLMTAGHLLPGLGAISLLITALAFCAIHFKPKLVIGLFAVVITNQYLVQLPTQSSFVAVDTSIPTLATEDITFTTDLATLKVIFEQIEALSSSYLVLPESTIKHWTKFTGSTISSRLEGSGKTLLIGAQYPEYDDSGQASWVNSIAMVNESSHQVIYKQGTPIPYFMWRPGNNGYKRNNANSLVSINDQTVKMLICYEVFTLRSILADIYTSEVKPDVFVSIGNYSWAGGTNIESIYHKKTRLISRLFMRPFVVSTNSQ